MIYACTEINFTWEGKALMTGDFGLSRDEVDWGKVRLGSTVTCRPSIASQTSETKSTSYALN